MFIQEALAVLLPLMDWLESTKKSQSGNETFVNEVTMTYDILYIYRLRRLKSPTISSPPPFILSFYCGSVGDGLGGHKIAIKTS